MTEQTKRPDEVNDIPAEIAERAAADPGLAEALLELVALLQRRGPRGTD